MSVLKEVIGSTTAWPIKHINILDVIGGKVVIDLRIAGPGQFIGSYAIPLPVGSVLVLKGNGADVAKHCVPAVPTKRISITFRRMGDQKRLLGHVAEPDLPGLQPLPYDSEASKNWRSSLPQGNGNKMLVVKRNSKEDSRA